MRVIISGQWRRGVTWIEIGSLAYGLRISASPQRLSPDFLRTSNDAATYPRSEKFLKTMFLS